MSLFPPHTRSKLDFSLLLSSTLDIFEARLLRKSVDQDFGLLHAVDERLACYGWMTNTGVKFVIVVDMAGRPESAPGGRPGLAAIVGLREADLKPVRFSVVIIVAVIPSSSLNKLMHVLQKAFKALQTAYVRLLQNPFYDPDEHTPMAPNGEFRNGGTEITSRIFIAEVKRIGEAWAPGVTNL